MDPDGLHGTLWSHDDDTVSFRSDAMNASRADHETVARYRRELGVTESARKPSGNTVAALESSSATASPKASSSCPEAISTTRR